MLKSIATLFLIPLVFLTAYCWVAGLTCSVYWYRKTWKSIKAGADPKAEAHWFDRYVFGRFAILSSPQLLTERGLKARAKTLAAMKMLGVGAALIAVTVPFAYFVGVAES